MVPSDDILFSVYAKIMNGHLNKFDGKAFEELGDKLVKGLISFYNQIMLDAVHFSPSGDRFTYQFNLREYSKVVEGTLQTRANLYKGPEGAQNVARCFIHEVKRVFFDRCVSEEDIGYL
jgi:hypothetical protein